jgi:hypothetical protein
MSMIIPKISVGKRNDSESATAEDSSKKCSENKDDTVKSSALIRQSVIGQSAPVKNGVIGQPELVTNSVVGSSSEAAINNGSSAVKDRFTEVKSNVMDNTLIARSADTSVVKDDNLLASPERKEKANKTGSGLTGIAADSFDAGSALRASHSLSAGPEEKSVLKRTLSSQQSTRC